jgi:hypothetical protein
VHNGGVIQSIRVCSTICNLFVLLDEIARSAEAGLEVVVAAIAGEVVPASDLCALLSLKSASEAAEELVSDALVELAG